MNFTEALNVFGATQEITQEELKKTYRRLALKNHPDKNPTTGSDMMKMINAAYEFLLKNFDSLAGASFESESFYNYGEEFENILNHLNSLSGLVFEVIGNWVWISGETKQHKDSLKALGCKWASKKKQWFYRPEEHRSFNRSELSIEEIRAKYGTAGRTAAKGKGGKAIERRA